MRTSLSWMSALVLAAACGDSGANTNASEATSTGEASSTASSTTSSATAAPTTGEPECVAGEVVCTSDVEQAACGPDGKLGAPMPCASGTCVDGMGCAECLPGELRCEGEALQQCSDAYAWEVLETCNFAQGIQCDPEALACVGECLPSALPRTAAGCEFYAVSAVQIPQAGGIFAVVLENPGASDANLTITGDKNFAPVTDTVPAGGIRVVTLPVVAKLRDANKGELVKDGAYRIQTDRPVRAYQYHTLNVTASADSSLLWPRHTWDTRYFVASYAATAVMGGSYRGAWAVVGGEDGLEVTVTPRPGTKAKGGPGIGVNGGGKAPLDAGDVLQILSADDGDLTGAMFVATGPIQVLGGHECSFVPMGVGHCDHLEEMMLPLSQLGSEYVVVPPSRHNPPTERRAQVVRVIATEANTTLTYDPPPMDAPTMIAGPGEFVELAPSAEPFVLVADKPVVVAQYMLGATFDGEETDPAMLIALPVARWHTSHWVHTLPDWLPIDVDILAPAGANVTRDGTPVTNFTDIGDSPYRVAHVRLTSDVGLVEIAADQPIAVNVYATTATLPTTSFWHSTGGLLGP